MKSLFDEEIKLSRVLVAFLLLGIGFYVLIKVPTPVSFCAILVAGLIGTLLVFGTEGIKKIFSRPKKGTFKVMIFYLFIAYVLSFSADLFGKYVLNQPAAGNPIGQAFAGSLMDSFIMLAKTIFMLAGEEIIVTLPLIIIISFLINKTKISKNKAIIISTIITSIFFGALHLSTYQWNLYQCLVVIGLTRIPFTIASLKADSMIGGIITHISFDWMIFILLIVTQL